MPRARPTPARYPSVLAAEQPVLKLHDGGDAVAVALRGEQDGLVAEPARLRKTDIVRGDGSYLPVQVDFAPKHGALGERHVVEGRQHGRDQRKVMPGS